MATSGYKQTDFCSRNGSNRYYLRVEWSRTSYSETANTSTISVNLYLGSHGNGYGMNASTTKTGSISINGTSYSISKAGLSLSSGGKIKIWGKTGIVIKHNTDGTKSFAISASFNPAVSVSGSSCGTATISSTTFTLNTIPQASTVSNTPNWTAGNNLTVNISRKSSSFTHTVEVLVGSTSIGSRSNVGASVTFSFSSSENQKIFGALGTSATSATATVKVTTYKSGTKVGSTQQKNGTVTNVASSSTTFTASANIGGTISGTITSKNKLFTHRIRLLQSNKSTVISTWLSNSTSSTAKSWSYTLPTSIYSLTPNSNNYTCYVEITTYWNGTTQQIGAIRYGTITAKVTGSNPTFNPTTNFTFVDYNTKTASLTNASNQYVIQGYSKLKATLASGGLATGVNSATIKEYHCTFANNTKKATHSAGTTCIFDFGVVNASTNQTMTITAVDSRGNKTTRNFTVYVIPYAKPKVITTVGRENGFTTKVLSSVKGSYSLLKVGSNIKNTLSAKMNFSNNGGAYGSDKTFTLTTSSENYTSNTLNDTLALTNVGKVKITVTDQLSSVVVEVDVSTGLPLFYVDSKMGSASFNKLPSYRSTLEMGLKVDLARNQYWGNGQASYGLNAGNSDIISINSLVFNDYSNNLGEGLRFPNSSYAWDTDYGHQNDSVVENGQTGTALKEVYGDYTNVFFRNQELWVDGGKFLQFNNTSYGANSWTSNYIYGFANGYILQCQDVDPAEANKNKGLILTDTSRSSQCHIDPNEIIWTAKNSSGVRVYSPNYLQASTHNIQVHAVGGESGESYGSLKLTSDSNGGYFQSSLIYNRTLSNAANVYINGSGTLYRSTSSARYKLDITPAFDSIEDYKKILDIEPVKWFDKASYEEYAQALTAEYNGEEPEELAGGNTPLSRVYGCVAEQLEEVGLSCLVTYEDDGVTTSGVAYDRIPIMYIPLFKDLYNQVEELKMKIQEMESAGK